MEPPTVQLIVRNDCLIDRRNSRLWVLHDVTVLMTLLQQLVIA